MSYISHQAPVESECARAWPKAPSPSMRGLPAASMTMVTSLSCHANTRQCGQLQKLQTKTYFV